ncbi:MarR family transcriptional regulator, partial [Escherichia coli]|nr:MarR family transcriptional regulator [Escherichia coli]
MEKETWEQLTRADDLFRKMVRRFVKERDRVSVEGVTLPAMLILQKIIRDGEQRLGDLAEQMDFTSGAITALSDKLEAAGYTVRRRKEDDRRTVLLDITAKGREMG